jgi:hypothetical protein
MLRKLKESFFKWINRRESVKEVIHPFEERAFQ